MEHLKNYFNMIVTAVICFFMGMIPGKKGNKEVVKVLVNGRSASSETWGMSGCREGVGRIHEFFGASDMRKKENNKSIRYKRPRIRKVFFWVGGPGDRPRPDPD